MGVFKAHFGEIDPNVFGINKVDFGINHSVFYQVSDVRRLSSYSDFLLFTTNSR